MHYFKTPLALEQISKLLQLYSMHPETNFCIVEIQRKKALVISDDESASLLLRNDANFKPVNISELDLITIPVMYHVMSVTGNSELFNQYINPQV
ncbi:MAG TPA: hypothetical protein PKM63_18025 [Panacibacter sp.]|nr:hypothetical protein [Panacibacter sp.]HNP46198.1 hypothetical protein [Panacibacter sp.]